MQLISQLFIGINLLFGGSAGRNAPAGGPENGDVTTPVDLYLGPRRGAATSPLPTPNATLWNALQRAPDCAGGARSEACDQVEVSSDDDRLADNMEPNHRIMVIDAGMEGTSLGIYKNRIVARYAADDTGHVKPARESMGVYRAFRDLVTLGVGGSAQSVPVTRVYDGVGGDIEIKISDNLPEPDHGYPIFNFLAEANPNSGFVILPYPMPSDDLFCNFDYDAIHGFYARAATDIQEVVKKHQVSLINLSLGIGRRELADFFEAQCGTPFVSRAAVRRFQAAEQVFYEALSNSSRTLLVEAAFRPSPGSVAADARLDCHTAGMPNRLRVEFVSYPQSDIPANGTSVANLAEYTLGGPACVDTYVNSGYEGDTAENPGDHPLVLKEGAGFDPFERYPLGPSYSAPLLVSLINYQWHLNPDPRGFNSSAIVQAFKNNGDATVYDPLTHHQLLSS